jgi:predicted enzyme related to lactoylglutathione lyase
MNRKSTMNISISLDSKNHKTVANFWINFLGAKLKSQDEDDLEYSRKASISLGGEIVKTNRSGDFEWSVMSDPEGNEFCIHQ